MKNCKILSETIVHVVLKRTQNKLDNPVYNSYNLTEVRRGYRRLASVDDPVSHDQIVS